MQALRDGQPGDRGDRRGAQSEDRAHFPIAEQQQDQARHGQADNNDGTFPIQSERLYQAVKGNGGTVRFVALPNEAHGYAARESVEHTLYEMVAWLDKHVKNAQ